MQGAIRDLFMQQALVLAVDEANRLLHVQWVGKPGQRRGVMILNDSSSLSLPRPSDIGLVLSDGVEFYYLGKMEYQYAGKTAGNYQEEGQRIRYPAVKDSEAHIGNVAKRTWLRFFRNGDFGLMSGMADGVEFLSGTRISKLIGKTVELVGNGVGVSIAAGVAKRMIPGVGEFPIIGTSGGKALEILMQIAYAGVQTTRFHMGEIKDLTVGLIDELSTYSFPLRVVLEVTAAALSLAALKMDVAGNVELKSTNTNVDITAGLNTTVKSGVVTNIDAPFVKLGDALGSTYSLVKGQDFLVWANTHVHNTPLGPTSPAVPQALFTMLSTKVTTE